MTTGITLDDGRHGEFWSLIRCKATIACTTAATATDKVAFVCPARVNDLRVGMPTEGTLHELP